LDQLTAFHDAKPDLPGIGLETMRKSAAPGLPARIFIEAARSLQASGDVTLDRMWMRLPSHEVRLSQADEQRLQSILPMLDAEPYRPPRVRDIAKAAGADENGVRRLLRMAARRGQVDEVAHDHFFSSAAVQAMAGVAIDLAASSPSGSFTAGDFRDRLDNGRKVAIQVLEYFDRHGLTMRRQDLRRIHDARVALFVRDRLSRAQ
jgi:selenocysteine-specific elongation factor